MKIPLVLHNKLIGGLTKGGKIGLIIFIVVIIISVLVVVIVLSTTSSSDSSSPTTSTPSTSTPNFSSPSIDKCTDCITSNSKINLINQNENCKTDNQANYLTGCRGSDNTSVGTSSDCDSGGCNKWKIQLENGNDGDNITNNSLIYLINQNANCTTSNEANYLTGCRGDGTGVKTASDCNSGNCNLWKISQI